MNASGEAEKRKRPRGKRPGANERQHHDSLGRQVYSHKNKLQWWFGMSSKSKSRNKSHAQLLAD